MARRRKTERKVRRHDPTKPPLNKPIPPGAVHIPPVPQGIELQAQRLMRVAGSAEAAKKAIDSAVEREATGYFLEDSFAARWGFASRRELLSASKPIFPDDNSNWWATQLKAGRWIVWSQDDLSARDTFQSFDEARKAVGSTAPAE